MKIEKAMHKGAKWVSPGTPISEVAALMKAEDIGSVLVGENERLVGMITDRDLALRVLPDGADPNALKARDVMTKGLVYCRTDQSIEDAIHLMEDRKIRDCRWSTTRSGWSAWCRLATSSTASTARSREN